MSKPLTIILNSINNKTEYLDADYIEKYYVPFLVNKIFAGFTDTILYANDMDINSHLSKQMQYDYYYYGLRKRRRFNPYVHEQIDPNIKLIMEYYNYSLPKAQEVIRIISDNDLNSIYNIMTKGGRV